MQISISERLYNFHIKRNRNSRKAVQLYSEIMHANCQEKKENTDDSNATNKDIIDNTTPSNYNTNTFGKYGYMLIKNAFSKETAEQCKEKIWDYMKESDGIDRYDQSTWTFKVTIVVTVISFVYVKLVCCL